MTEVFALDDLVTWTSQANGSAISKTGKIIAVIPPGQCLQDVLLCETTRTDVLVAGDKTSRHYDASRLEQRAQPRDIESYLVAVVRQRRRGMGLLRPRLYWPRVQSLQHVAQENAG